MNTAKSHRCLYCGLRTEGAIECADDGGDAVRCVLRDPTVGPLLFDAVVALRKLSDRWRREDKGLRTVEQVLTGAELLGRNAVRMF